MDNVYNEKYEKKRMLCQNCSKHARISVPKYCLSNSKLTVHKLINFGDIP